jgi:hypothetical protein
MKQIETTSSLEEQPQALPQSLINQRGFDRFAPTLVPAFTGIGAVILISTTAYDLINNSSIKITFEMLSHLFWLASATTGVIYNLRCLRNR